jgi:spore photoproduct lyase
MFEKIFIESNLIDHPKVKNILARFPNTEAQIINKVEDIFGRVKKPYLQKRETLNLFLGEKKGQLVKVAPNAYGVQGEPHYYFAQAYNCIYECDYCYLQGYFNSPDIVLFLNHEEIGAEMKRIANSHAPIKTWFHAGEFSDSLALSHLSGELDFYFKLFKDVPEAYLELRTKSINIKELLKQSPLPNIITSFSLSPQKRSKKNDLKTPSTERRLKAIAELNAKNFPMAIHFDPIIYDENIIELYSELIQNLSYSIPLEKIRYISLGVVRFTKDVFHQVQVNYPESDLLHHEFIKSFDNKIRYNRPMRMWILQKIKELLIFNGMTEDQIYFCMEED